MNKGKVIYKTETPKVEKESKFLKTIGVFVLVFCFSITSFVAGRVFQEYWGYDIKYSFTNLRSIVDRRDFQEDSVENFDSKLFWRVWDTLESSYVDEGAVDEMEMYYGAIKGVVSSVDDPGTVFLTPEETELFNKQHEGKYFEGIGAELGYREGSIIVIAPIEGSPAKEAGVQSGDLIVKVDGELVKQSDSLHDVAYRIRGDAGTEVIITIMRAGEFELREIPIVRGEITVPSMTLEINEDSDVYVLNIGRFTESSLLKWNNLWDSKIQEFLEAGGDKLVVDLRGNPGGFFDAGVYAAEEFLERGEQIAKQEYRSGRVEDYISKRNGRLLDTNVVILVNEGSASASEIFAGAMQQNDRALIVGGDTYGKGTAQNVIDYPDGSSLLITIIKWLLPDGSWINEDNVVHPDVKVEVTDEDFKKGVDVQLEKAVELLQK